MGSLELYKEKHSGNEASKYYKMLEDKPLEENKYGEKGYAGDQFTEILERRAEESMLEDHKSYYFSDRQMLEKKVIRYNKLAADEDGAVASFAAQHKNHSARKRKKKARNAAKAFEKAAQLERTRLKYLSPVEQFRHENEIMKLRLEGRIEAAKAKSTSKENEAYRIAKAKYSCAHALKTQLDALIKQDPENAELIQAREKLERQLVKEKKNFERNAPTQAKRWNDAIGANNKTTVRNRLAELKKVNRTYNEEDARLEIKVKAMENYGMDYIKQHYENGKGAYNPTPGDESRIFRSMCRYTYQDKNGKPLSEEDAKKEEFNRKWIELCGEDSKQRLKEAKEKGYSPDELRELEDEVERKDYERQKMIKERYDIFEKAPLPTPEQFKEKGSIGLFEENPAFFSECVNLALTTNNLQEKEPYLEKYINEHPLIDLKLRLWAQIGSAYMDKLDNVHLIKQGKGTVTNISEKEDYDESDSQDIYQKDYEKLMAGLATEKQKEEAYKKDNTKEKPQSVIDAEQEKEKDVYFKIKAERKAYAKVMNSPKSLEDLRKVNDSITEEGYAIYEKARQYNNISNDPQLLELVNEAQKIYNDKSDVTISRFYAPVLREVKYNDRFEPADKQAVADHEWNVKFCTAFKEKDMKTVDEMVLQTIPKIYEEIGNDIPEPEELDVYCDKMLKESPDKLIIAASKTLGLSNLKKYSKAATKFMNENKEFNALSDVFGALLNYMEFYSQYKYGIDYHTGGKGVKAVKKNVAEQMKDGMEGMLEMYKINLATYREITGNK